MQEKNTNSTNPDWANSVTFSGLVKFATQNRDAMEAMKSAYISMRDKLEKEKESYER